MKKIGLIALLIVCSIFIVGGSIAFARNAAPAEYNQTIVETVDKKDTTEVEETTIEPVEEETIPEETTVVIEKKETIVNKFIDIEYVDCMDIRTIDGLYLPECLKYLVELNKYLGDEKWAEEYVLIQNEISRINDIKGLYEERIKYLEEYGEYPTATIIWYYLKDLGYSDAVCAGILGNIMAEAGGQTLNIQVNAVNAYAGHYGICQWSTYYYPEINGASLELQLNYLRDTIEYQINTFGNNYCYGFNYNQFLQVNSAEEAAVSFALTYERCGGNSYWVRQSNAKYAYDYFVN